MVPQQRQYFLVSCIQPDRIANIDWALQSREQFKKSYINTVIYENIREYNNGCTSVVVPVFKQTGDGSLEYLS